MSNAARARPRLSIPRARPGVRAAALAGVVGLILAGCVAPKQQTTLPEPEPGVDEPATPPPAGQSLAELYDQDVGWVPCGDDECTTVAVPLDWDDPEAGSIGIAVKRVVATGSADERIGSLLINPGGPGGSGIDFLSSVVDYVVSDDVRAAYDIVGFDPRGVGQSSAVDCGDDALVDAYFTTDVPMEDQADVEAARADLAAFGQACLEATGPLLGEVDTVSAARDMDLLRAVLGDSELYYLGFSYGTFLGATYAGLYPENVGRLVLDGALDPSMSSDDLSIGQAIGFENALRAYVEYCQSTSDCPLTGSVDDGMAQVAEIASRAEADPIPAYGGATVNGTMAFYGIVVTLYDDASWRYLTMALSEVVSTGTATTLLELANFYLDRTPDGQYTANVMVAFTAINCLDYPMEVRDYDEMVAFAEEVAEGSPTFGRDFGMAIGCETWPFPATGVREPITAPGAAPILVIGTTGDPATPYEWSVALAEQLESASLLTWEGEGHTAYGRGGQCVDEIVEAYLLDGEVPADGARC